MANASPVLLIVDDEPDQQRNILNGAAGDVIMIRHPRDVVLDDLHNADVVLVDYKIEDWAERDRASHPIAFRPMNGVALASVFRAHAEQATRGAPTAFALRSNHLKELCPATPDDVREHSIARSLNLEWVFSKTDPFDRIRILGHAVKLLPEAWPTDDPDATRDVVARFLSLPDTNWANEAWQDVTDCHPPVHELSKQSHGLAFIRWFGQRILPYPCFLSDPARVAARLRVTEQSLVMALNGALGESMRVFEYTGGLAGFIGKLWWRAGLEDFIWSITGGDSSDPAQLRGRIKEKLNIDLEPIALSQPIICVDRNFNVLKGVFTPDDAVRIQPDDWPPYADQAWTTVELATTEASLRALVVEADIDRVPTGGAR